MKRQRGVTLGGVLVFMLVIGFATYTGSRIMPGYMDYWTLQRIMKNILEQPDLQDMKERAIRAKFTKELQMNNMNTSINEDLVIDQVPNGVQLSLDYVIERPFMGPISFLMNFHIEETSK